MRSSNSCSEQVFQNLFSSIPCLYSALFLGLHFASISEILKANTQSLAYKCMKVFALESTEIPMPPRKYRNCNRRWGGGGGGKVGRRGEGMLKLFHIGSTNDHSNHDYDLLQPVRYWKFSLPGRHEMFSTWPPSPCPPPSPSTFLYIND